MFPTIDKSIHINSKQQSHMLQDGVSSLANQNIVTDDVSKLNIEFNELKKLYAANYELLITELSNNNKYNDTIVKYADKNIIYNNIKYYVNKYGFAQKYTGTTWSNRPSSCSSNAVTIPKIDFDKLLHSTNLEEGQECGIAGYNIESKVGKQKAWVDIQGKKHIYSNNIWDDKHKSCDREPTIIDDSLYNTIPEYSPMTISSPCNNINVDPIILNNLSMLNEQLLTLAIKILGDFELLEKEDIVLKEDLSILKTNISNSLITLENDKKKLKLHGKNQIIELENKLTDSELRVTSSYTKYIIWCIICFAILSLTYYSFISNSASNIIIGVTAVLLFFIIYYEILPRFNKLRVSIK